MNPSSCVRSVSDSPEPGIFPSPSVDSEEIDAHVRAIRALGILLSSKLIDEAEYDRRIAFFGVVER